MNILKAISDAIRYLTDAATSLFAPDHDDYPKVGVQPFDGEPYSKWVSTSDKPVQHH